jgi:hypothetical protein
MATISSQLSFESQFPSTFSESQTQRSALSAPHDQAKRFVRYVGAAVRRPSIQATDACFEH